MFSLFNNSYTNEVSDFETLQNARKDLVGEIEAIIQYDEHLHNSNNRLARQTWESIKNDELLHVGELLGLINYLDSSQLKYVEDGIKEFNGRLLNN